MSQIPRTILSSRNYSSDQEMSAAGKGETGDKNIRRVSCQRKLFHCALLTFPRNYCRFNDDLNFGDPLHGLRIIIKLFDIFIKINCKRTASLYWTWSEHKYMHFHAKNITKYNLKLNAGMFLIISYSVFIVMPSKTATKINTVHTRKKSSLLWVSSEKKQ